MYNICLRMTGNRQDAEDILQDAFYQAYSNIGKLKSVDSFGPWLKKIVINRCIRFLQTRISYVDLDPGKHPVMEEEYDMSDLDLAKINEEIRKLPDGCRIIFNLYLLEDHSHKEIAQMLGISESTSKSQYQRARKLLQEQLKKLQVYG